MEYHLEAFSLFCVAVCPVDQRGRLADRSTVRAELALAQRFGGLGIRCVAVEAPLRAADQWAHRDAVEAGMLLGNAATAYRRPEGPIDSSAMQPIGMDAYYTAGSDSVGEALTRALR